jgi:hypothetical protein
LDPTGVSITRTFWLNPRARSAVSSLHPLATTITSISPDSIASRQGLRQRWMTADSLWAGMMRVAWGDKMVQG